MKDILSHPYFKEVRQPDKEKVEDEKIAMDFEDEDLTFARLRELFVKEIQEYHPDL